MSIHPDPEVNELALELLRYMAGAVSGSQEQADELVRRFLRGDVSEVPVRPDQQRAMGAAVTEFVRETLGDEIAVDFAASLERYWESRRDN